MFYTDYIFPLWFELLLPLLSILTSYTFLPGLTGKELRKYTLGSIVLFTHLSPVLAPPGEDVSSQREATMHYLADPGNHRSHTSVWYLDPSAQSSVLLLFCLLLE